MEFIMRRVALFFDLYRNTYVTSMLNKIMPANPKVEQLRKTKTFYLM